MAFDEKHPRNSEQPYHDEAMFTNQYGLDLRLSRFDRRLTRISWLAVAAVSCTNVAFIVSSTALGQVRLQGQRLLSPTTLMPSAHNDPETFEIVHNKETAISNVMPRDVALAERGINWGLGITLFSAVAFPGGFYNLVDGCSETDDGTVKATTKCVLSALTTAASFLTLGNKGASAAGTYFSSIAATGLSDIELTGPFGGRRRRSLSDVPEDVLNAYNANISSVFKYANYSLDGFLHKSNSVAGRLIPDSHEYWPVHSFVGHGGHTFHHAVFPSGNGTFRHTLAFATKSSNIKGRDTYNDVDFSSGGLEISDCPGPGGTQLDNSAKDFTEIESDIDCIFPDDATLQANSGLELEIYDISADGIIESGAIAAVSSDGTSDVGSIPGCPTIAESFPCGSVQFGD